MFEQIIAALNKPLPNNAFASVQRLTEQTLRLSQAQMEVMKGLTDEIGQECRALGKPTDPSSWIQNWVHLMTAATRANTEAAAHLMKNAQEYQSELVQMMQSANPGATSQFMSDMMGLAKTSPVANGGAAMQAARARKAA